MDTKTPPPEPLDFGGGDRLVVALVGISAVAIQRWGFGSLKSIYVCRSFSAWLLPGWSRTVGFPRWRDVEL